MFVVLVAVVVGVDDPRTPRERGLDPVIVPSLCTGHLGTGQDGSSLIRDGELDLVGSLDVVNEALDRFGGERGDHDADGLAGTTISDGGGRRDNARVACRSAGVDL